MSAPAEAKRWHMAVPIPPPPPVTTTLLPAKVACSAIGVPFRFGSLPVLRVR
jgi:hypothetical protein